MSATGPDREGFLAWLRHQAGALVFSLRPVRVKSVLLLWPATFYAWLRPGPRIPDVQSMPDWPAGYAGPVRDRSPEAMYEGMRRGFHLMQHWGPWKWWSPPQRAVTWLEDVHVPRKLRKHVRKAGYRITFDTAFDDVLRRCGMPRRRFGITWLRPDVRQMFSRMHALGLAHSVEVWDGAGNLVGGGFGVAAGPVFSGYSLFHTEDNASKIAVISLCHHLHAWGMRMIDHQRPANWSVEQGAILIEREEFLANVAQPGPPCSRPGVWTAQFTAEESALWNPRAAASSTIASAID